MGYNRREFNKRTIYRGACRVKNQQGLLKGQGTHNSEPAFALWPEETKEGRYSWGFVRGCAEGNEVNIGLQVSVPRVPSWD
jgi:hypothetical protein